MSSSYLVKLVICLRFHLYLQAPSTNKNNNTTITGDSVRPCPKTKNKNNIKNDSCNTKSMQLSPWRAPGSSPVLDSCGMAGGTPAAGIILDNGTQQNKYILDNQMQQ